MKQHLLGQLNFVMEGEMLHAYALPGEGEPPIIVGSIHAALVAENDAVKGLFVELIKRGMLDLFQRVTGGQATLVEDVVH